MTEITTQAISVIGALSGLSGIIVSLLYYKENKRRKKAEAKAIDIDSLVTTIEVLQKDKEVMHNDMRSMKKEIDTLKSSLRISDAEKIGIERNLNIHKRAIGCRVKCDQPVCPIEAKLNELIPNEILQDGQASN